MLDRIPVRQIATYVVNGVVANGVDIGGFFVLDRLGLWYVHASFVSGVLGTITAFLLHKHIAFKKPGKHVPHALKFGLLAVFNIFAVAGILYACVEWFGLPELPAKIIANGSQAVWGFLLMKFVVYT